MKIFILFQAILISCLLSSTSLAALTPAQSALVKTWQSLFTKTGSKASGYSSTSYTDVLEHCGYDIPITFDESLFKTFDTSKKPDDVPHSCNRIYQSLSNNCRQDPLSKAAITKNIKKVICKGSPNADDELFDLKAGVLTYTTGSYVTDRQYARGTRREIFFKDMPSAFGSLTLLQAQDYEKTLKSLKEGDSKSTGLNEIKTDCGVDLTLDFDESLSKNMAGTGHYSGMGCGHLIGVVHSMCGKGWVSYPEYKELSKKVKGIACRFNPSAPRYGGFAFKNGVLSIEHEMSMARYNDKKDATTVAEILKKGK